MRTILIVVAVTLAVVIAVVAGVYGWTLMSVPVPLEGLPTPPPKRAVASRPPSRPPAKPAETSSSAPARPSTEAAPKDAVLPAPPPPTYVAGEGQAPTVSTPGTLPDEGQTPRAEPDAAVPGSMEERLYALLIGLSEDQVVQIMGEEGRPDSSANQGEFIPQGWYALRWSNPEGESISALFNDAGYLVHLEPFKIPGAIDWMNDSPHYSITTWLNDSFRAANLSARLPAVDVAATSTNTYQFQAGLVNSAGQFVGTVSGAYYAGDGLSTYIPGDSQPYARAIEGSYEFIEEDGIAQANTFGLIER